MNLRMVGCSHQQASVKDREQIAFSTDEAGVALELWQQRFPATEAVLLSTCNRMELYTAVGGTDDLPPPEAIHDFLATVKCVEANSLRPLLAETNGQLVVEHLFAVAASVESMVVGESQISSQVRAAYELADSCGTTGPVTHSVFQAALRTARRVANETSIQRRRVSIPSVAVADFATRVFERFDDKRVLVLGAGEMAEETLEHLVARGTRDIIVCNRSRERGTELARRFAAKVVNWDDRWTALVESDFLVATTGASEPVITADEFSQRVVPARHQRAIFMLDLAVPRDIEPAVGDCLGTFLYSIDDLREACDANLQKRQAELPAARHIIGEETEKFMIEQYHRASGPTIKRLRKEWQGPKEEELRRLLNKLPDLDERGRAEVAYAFDRLINKLLHPPLESLRDEARHGPPHGLIEALRRLFRLDDD